MPAWIATIPPSDATGRLEEAYASQKAKLGHVTELTRLGSPHPPPNPREIWRIASDRSDRPHFQVSNASQCRRHHRPLRR
jgi:hypothetical protein